MLLVCISGRSARLTGPSALEIHPQGSGGDPNWPSGNNQAPLWRKKKTPVQLLPEVELSKKRNREMRDEREREKEEKEGGRKVK
jgi:hypothetical protein